MEFLHDIVPKKVKFGDYLKMMEEEKSSEDEDDGDLLWIFRLKEFFLLFRIFLLIKIWI